MITYLFNNEVMSEQDLREDAQCDISNPFTAHIEDIISVLEELYDTTIVIEDNE